MDSIMGFSRSVAVAKITSAATPASDIRPLTSVIGGEADVGRGLPVGLVQGSGEAKSPDGIQPAHGWSRVPRGYEMPFGRWVRGELQSPWRDATAYVALSRIVVDPLSG